MSTGLQQTCQSPEVSKRRWKTVRKHCKLTHPEKDLRKERQYPQIQAGKACGVEPAARGASTSHRVYGLKPFHYLMKNG